MTAELKAGKVSLMYLWGVDMHSIGMTLITGALFCFFCMLFAAGLTLDGSNSISKFGDYALALLTIVGLLLVISGLILSAFGI